MNETWLISISVLLQGIAVVVQVIAAQQALKLIRITGKSPAWVLISAGFCIMAARRIISIARVLAGDPNNPPDPLDDGMSLVISGVMFAGVMAVSPLLLSIKEAAAVLQQDKEV